MLLTKNSARMKAKLFKVTHQKFSQNELILANNSAKIYYPKNLGVVAKQRAKSGAFAPDLNKHAHPNKVSV